MALNYLNPIHSSAAVMDGANSTYHTLSGQAEQLLLTATGITFYVNFESTATLTDSTGMMYCPADEATILSVNAPEFINVFATATGYVYIMEFI